MHNQDYNNEMKTSESNYFMFYNLFLYFVDFYNLNFNS